MTNRMNCSAIYKAAKAIQSADIAKRRLSGYVEDKICCIIDYNLAWYYYLSDIQCVLCVLLLLMHF
jgi:hypothetical protein